MDIPRFRNDASPAAVLEAIESDGAAILDHYLSAAEVERKRADLERVLATVSQGRNDFEGFATQRIYALFAKTRTFDYEAIDPLILELAEGVLGSGFLLSAPTAIRIGPGESAQNLHRDDAVYPIPRPHPELVLNTMWALDDFTEANGATHVVPGSHRHNELSGSDVGDGEWVAAEMPAGSVMAWVGSLLHGGGANTTDGHRLGVILEYCAGWVRPQENHVLGVPREIVRELPERLMELLGYSIHGAFLGNVDGRHPRKYLDDRREVQDGVLTP